MPQTVNRLIILTIKIPFHPWRKRSYSTEFQKINTYIAEKQRYYFIRSKLYRDNNTVDTPGTNSCHQRRCNTCNHIAFGNTVRGPNITWNVKGSYTCISSNVIYAITCSCCEKEATSKLIHLKPSFNQKQFYLTTGCGAFQFTRTFLTLKYLS